MNKNISEALGFSSCRLTKKKDNIVRQMRLEAYQAIHVFLSMRIDLLRIECRRKSREGSLVEALIQEQ